MPGNHSSPNEGPPSGDSRWMRLALEQAARSLGCTSPNPPVGAVIVCRENVVATGHHRRAGGAHAEIEALREFADHGGDPDRASLYVTLEPCSTHGRTPPCTDAIVAAGVGHVVFGSFDPNPRHAGRAVEILRRAGIRVEAGILRAECDHLIRIFRHWIVHQRPYVIAKSGLSLDGRLTRPPGESQWLTSPASRADAQLLRQEVDAVLVGAETVRQDNPRLTLRNPDLPKGKIQPWRVVLTRSGDLPRETHHLFTDEHRARTLVLSGLTIPEVMDALAERQITSVLVEGGAQIVAEAIRSRAVHEIRHYFAPLLTGGPKLVARARKASSKGCSVPLLEPCFRRLGSDVVVEGKPDYR